MTRNIMTGEGKKPVEAATEFEVSGIKLFTYYNTEWEEWRVVEMTCGYRVSFSADSTEEKAIRYAKAKIANVGAEKVMERVRAMIARCGVANEED